MPGELFWYFVRSSRNIAWAEKEEHGGENDQAQGGKHKKKKKKKRGRRKGRKGGGRRGRKGEGRRRRKGERKKKKKKKDKTRKERKRKKREEHLIASAASSECSERGSTQPIGGPGHSLFFLFLTYNENPFSRHNGDPIPEIRAEEEHPHQQRRTRSIIERGESLWKVGGLRKLMHAPRDQKLRKLMHAPRDQKNNCISN